MKIKRSHAVVVLLGLGVTGVIGASAASLNGVNAQNLGADTNVVASCDTDGVTVAWSTAPSTSGTPIVRVTSANLSNIAAACNGQAIKVSVYDSTGASLGSATTTANAVGTATASFAASVDAELVENVSVVISG